MTRTPAEAIAWAQNQSEHGPRVHEGMCLKMVRTALDVPAKYLRAIDAWDHAEHRRGGGIVPPVGVPVFWRGGHTGAGHVALSAGNGYVWSTDWKRNGYFDKAAIADITRDWHETYLGWTEDLNAVPVYKTTEPKPVAKPSLREALQAVCDAYDESSVRGARALLADASDHNTGTRLSRIRAAAVQLRGMS